MNLPCCERQRCRRSRQRDWRARTVSADNDSFIGATTIAGGKLELAAGEITAGNAESGQAILFTGDPSLRIDGLVMPTGALFGFVASDTLDLADVPYDHGQNVGERVTLTAANVLQVSEGRTEYDLAFDPAQSFAGMYFHLAPDGGSGADITTNTTP